MISPSLGEGDTLELETDHRCHAESENAIRDLKYGVGLNHLPSGRFPANAAWLAVQSLPPTRYGVMAHNLARWTSCIGLNEGVVTTKTLRCRLFSLAERVTRRARQTLPASAPAVALGNPVSLRPGTVAGNGMARLTPFSPKETASPTKQMKVSPQLAPTRLARVFC